jgi:hypothetical protein
VTSHEEVSWSLTLRQEIPNIQIGHINVNKGVFCLIISYLQIKSYDVLNYNNCSSDRPFPLRERKLNALCLIKPLIFSSFKSSPLKSLTKIQPSLVVWSYNGTPSKCG